MKDEVSPSSNSDGQTDKPGWFDRPGNVRRVLFGLYGACALLVLIDVALRVIEFDKHPYFEWERWPGFQAVYGFISCVFLVFLAKYVLRPLVMRKENFYERSGEPGAVTGNAIRGKEDQDG